ncbi:MAG: hypothetical protein AAF750_11450 [Planctomycetota bacterium]
MPVFPTTHWSIVKAIQHADADSQYDLLENFLRRYLRVFQQHVDVRFRGVPLHEREDIVQGFVTDRIVEGQILTEASQARGRLRSFLRVCLNNYALSALRSERPVSSFELQDDELEEQSGVACAFDIAWMDQVLADTVTRFKDKCYNDGRQELWDVFDLRIGRPALVGSAPVAYDTLAAQLGLTAHQVRSLLVTAKRGCHKCLRDVIGEYATSVADIDAEIDDLRRIAGSRRQQARLIDML